MKELQKVSKCVRTVAGGAISTYSQRNTLEGTDVEGEGVLRQ